MLNHFKNLSWYEEFEIRCALMCISKVDVLKVIGHQINDYYFFVSEDGVFNWYDLNGNHIENPGVLKEISGKYIPGNILKCIIPDGVTRICNEAFSYCVSLTTITIPDSVTRIGYTAFSYCKSLTSITIPNNVKIIDYQAFWFCESLKEVIFKEKTMDQVKQMKNYPFGIKDKSIIKCEM